MLVKGIVRPSWGNASPTVYTGVEPVDNTPISAYNLPMNRLPTETRAMILHMLVEGNSMRGISRLMNVRLETVTKLLLDAGDACLAHHNRVIRNLDVRYVQCDEMWAFCYAKETNAWNADGAIDWAGDVWTWVGIDADTKLVLSWLASDRTLGAGRRFMQDLKTRVGEHTMISTDGHVVYPQAISDVFEPHQVDYHQIAHGTERTGELNNSYVERNNLTMRMSSRRLMRRTNGFSKKYANHVAALALNFTYYNFCRPHESLGKRTPAAAAGLDPIAHDPTWIVKMIDERTPAPRRSAFYLTKRIRAFYSFDPILEPTYPA